MTQENIWFNIANAKVGEKVTNNFDGEDWICIGDNNDNIKDNDAYKRASILDENQSRLSFDGMVKVKDYYIAAYSGGLNGGGGFDKWQTYLEDIKTIFKNLGDSWMINLENDCCDDVWYITIGFSV